MTLALGSALLLAVGLAGLMYEYPPPGVELALSVGCAGAAVLLLAITRFDAAVATGFLLLGVVVVEPAPTDVVLAIVIAVAAVTGRVHLIRIPPVISLTAVAFLVLNLLSAIAAVDAGRALFFIAVTLYLVVLSLWLSDYVDSFARAKLVVVAYLGAALASATLGVLALLVQLPGQDLLNLRSDRATALFKDPNVFGPFLIPPALIMLEELLRPRLLRVRPWMKALLLLGLLLGILFSYSRSAWLNLLIAVTALLAVLWLRRERSATLGAVVGIILAAAAISAAVVATTGSADFLEERARVQTYDRQRFDAQRVGLELAAQRPVGIGPGQFEAVVQYGAHSTFVRVFAEQGPLGLLLFGMLAVGTLWLAASNTLRGVSTYGIGSAALLAAWCGLLANSFFVDTLHWRHFWVVAGLIWAGAMRTANLPSQRRRSPT